MRFHVNSKGVWTLTYPEKEKIRKKLTFTGFDPGTFSSQEQNTTPELRRHITWFAPKKLRIQYSYDTVLANFSQFPPLCANFHLYSTHLYPLRQLFFVYNFLVIPCSLFENILFWLYFWNPWVIFIFFCGRLIYFLSIFLPFTYIFCTFVQTQEKKSHW